MSPFAFYFYTWLDLNLKKMWTGGNWNFDEQNLDSNLFPIYLIYIVIYEFRRASGLKLLSCSSMSHVKNFDTFFVQGFERFSLITIYHYYLHYFYLDNFCISSVIQCKLGDTGFQRF